MKDHHVFWYSGYYYLVSIYIGPENRFAYARSPDLCNWEELPPILTQRLPGSWDSMAIWAPFVYAEGDLFYLYYAGVTTSFTQSILYATTIDPADPDSWQPQGLLFQPDHPAMVWEADQWADCRDPTLVKVGNTYYLYYTGLDVEGGIIGVATASSPLGPWRDWGSIVPAEPQVMLESSTLAHYDEAYYLIYHEAGGSEFYRSGPGPSGPWGTPSLLRPGWAHEVWQTPGGDWFTSYLTDYSVRISPLTWDTWFSPPRPVIGSASYRLHLPLAVSTAEG